MYEPIELAKALQQRRAGALFVDVRTPAEFDEATIPGAINVPIFSNEERAHVGTVYKQQGSKVARRLGVKLVSPKIPQIIDTIESAWGGRKGPVIVFCWRGGMRSQAICTFLNLAGVPARQLIGGHKAFRREVLDYFEQTEWPPIYVLRGLTGVGKTRVLNYLKKSDFPVIDLEGLANHRGSAFGNLGLSSQPSQKKFEALLWARLETLEKAPYLVTEGESLHIGRVVVPKRFHAAMQIQTSLWLTASLETRVRVILEEYPARDQMREQFRRPLLALKERLGRKKVEEFCSLLDQGEWETLTRELMIRYYDPLYMHTHPPQRIEIDLDPFTEGVKRVAAALKTLTNLDSAGG
jgi:tRNA 2-selenouridine synthase